MKTGMIISATMHVVAVLAMIFGLPFVWANKDIRETPILVELVKIGDITRPQKPPEPKKKPEPPKPKPKPKPKKEAAKPPPPPAAPKQKAPPKRSELALPKPKSKKKPVVEKEAPPKAKFAAAPKPPSKPKRQRRFDSNRIAALLDKTEKKKEIPLTEKLAKLKEKAPPPTPEPQSSDVPLTMTEIDAIRYQIEQCWIVPGGARDAENLVVRIKFSLNPDGSLAKAPEIVDTGGRMSDSFYRAAADSARRAVIKCSPLKQLPVDKYERWREITLTFNPQDMVGG